MAGRRYEERVYTATTNPITGWDLLGMSNDTDGGTTYDLSKKITVDELAAFLVTAFGLDGPDNTVPFFFEGALRESHMFWGEGGMYLPDRHFGIGIIHDADITLKIKGDTNDNTEQAIIAYNSDGIYTLWLDNDGGFWLKNGTDVDEISLDSDFSGATNDQLATRLAIKTYVESALNPPWKPVVKGFADFSFAGLTTTITGYTLADGEDFTGIRLVVDTALSGPSITSVIVSVGIAGKPQEFIPNFDASIALADYYEGGFNPIMGAPTDVIITITVIGANLDVLDAGSMTIKFKTSQS